MTLNGPDSNSFAARPAKVKTMASLKVPGLVAIGVLAVMLRAAAFVHNPAAYFVAVVLWLLGVLIIVLILRK